MSESTPASSRPFQVHLRGVVELLSRSIYSSPRVYLRELLQNGVDAIAAREGADEPGAIRIRPVSAEHPDLVVEDDGIGLTLAEISELLATVGRSSKRDVLDLPRTDRLGRFGIGLLSCFMVTDAIVVHSRSARGGPAVEWIGSADGTFTARELDDEESEALRLGIGSRVTLRPRSGDTSLVETATVLQLARDYGEYLPVPVRVAREGSASPTWDEINRDPVFTRSGGRPSDEVLALGRELIGATPLDAIDLHVPSTGTRGTAFVLPFAPTPGARQATRVHLGGMLLGDRVDDVLPDWAFFVRSIIDTTGLHPTASREDLVDDDALAETRDALGAAIRRWIIGLASTSPRRLAEFLAVHHLALRSLALHDDELAVLIVPHLDVETSNGRTTIGELVRAHPHVRFAATVDEFRQIAGITAREAPVVNGGYVFDGDLLRRLPEIVPGTSVEQVSVTTELENLDEPPLADRAASRSLESRASDALRSLDCAVSVRSFRPADVTSLYVADPEALQRLRRRDAQERTSPLWSSVLGRLSAPVDDAGETGPAALGLLCLNWAAPLVRTLAGLEDELVFARTARLLYVQALLASHRPLRAIDRATLTESMTDLVHLSVGLTAETAPHTDTRSAPTTDEDPRR